jgi:hypothetical protein
MLTIVKKNDSYDAITYQLENEDNSTVDLTGASVNFVMGKKNKLITNAKATVTSATSGIVSYQLTQLDTLVSGTFLAEFVVTFANGTVKTYPSNGYITVDVEQNLDTSQANVIVDMIAEKQGDFTSKLNSILLQAGNINMSAMNEYSWTATEGQLIFIFPSSVNYTPSTKWFQVSVGNVPVDNTLVNRSYDNQFALNIDSSNIKAGMTVRAMWVEPITPVVPNSYKIIPQQDLPPVDAGEGDLWFDTSDNTYQGTVFDTLNSQLAEKVSYATGLVLNDQTKATANATLINQLLTQGNVRLPIGDIYIDNTIVIPSNTSLIGEKGKTNVRMVTLNKHIIQLKQYSSVKDMNLYFPNGLNSLVGGIYMNAVDNVVFYDIDNVVINGLAPWNTGELSAGILQDGTSSGSIYYGHAKATVINCYYGVKQIGGLASLNANKFTDLVLENNKWQMDLAGGGNAYRFTAQTYSGTIHTVTCSGSNNIFEGVIYDLQTGVSGLKAYEFSNTASNNTYLDWVGGYLTSNFIIDSGTMNRITNPSYEMKQFMGFGEVRGVDSNGVASRIYPGFYGMQDNALAFIHKRGTVTLNSGTITSGTIQKIFDPTQPFTGTTFSDPSISNIVIQVDYPQAYQTNFFGIIFDGSSFPDRFEIWTKTSSGGTYNLFTSVTNNQRSNWYFAPSTVGYNGYWGIQVKIYSAFNNANYNTNKQVNIKSIWATDSLNGGQTFLKQGGGTLYGNLNMGGNYLTVGNVASLPTASAAFRGQIIYVQGNGTTTADTAYQCLMSATGTYSWKQIIAG